MTTSCEQLKQVNFSTITSCFIFLSLLQHRCFLSQTAASHSSLVSRYSILHKKHSFTTRTTVVTAFLTLLLVPPPPASHHAEHGEIHTSTISTPNSAARLQACSLHSSSYRIHIRSASNKSSFDPNHWSKLTDDIKVHQQGSLATAYHRLSSTYNRIYESRVYIYFSYVDEAIRYFDVYWLERDDCG